MKKNLNFLFLISCCVFFSLVKSAKSEEDSNKVKIGDEIVVVGKIVLSKGYELYTKCLEIENYPQEILNDSDLLDSSKELKLNNKCHYSIGNPRFSQALPVKLGKFLNKWVKMSARVEVSEPGNDCKEGITQVPCREVVYLYPLNIDENNK